MVRCWTSSSPFASYKSIPTAAAGLQNFDLTIYLFEPLADSDSIKFTDLLKLVPAAKPEDWLKVTAGLRVQVMKKDPKKVDILQFGAEVVASEGAPRRVPPPPLRFLLQNLGS